MTPPTKFALMRLNRRRADERRIRARIEQAEQEETATWGPIRVTAATGPAPRAPLPDDAFGRLREDAEQRTAARSWFRRFSPWPGSY